VLAKVKLHKGLQFRNEIKESLSDDKSLLVREIGNVTVDTEMTFEYTMKHINVLAQMDDINLEQITTFPF